jgi:hypothetical protein
LKAHVRIVLLALLWLGGTLCSAAEPFVEPALQLGFNHLYNLEFNEAHRTFQQWLETHPDDPRAPVFDAAAYLFAEFDRLHILQSEFFAQSTFSRRAAHQADPAVYRAFMSALARAKTLADARLQRAPHDQNALFSNLLSYGLQADYHALIDRRDLQALSDTSDGRRVAAQLLAEHPDCYDAYLAEGVENYLLSQKAAPVRWMLHLAGAGTDKERGLAKLRLTAEKGVYLRPYAQLLLAIAALRDGNHTRAEQLLSALSAEFPRNQLYRNELAKLKKS